MLVQYVHDILIVPYCAPIILMFEGNDFFKALNVMT